MKKNENTEKCYFPFKKTLSVILAIVMAFSALSVVAAAANTEEEKTEKTHTAVKEEEKQSDEPQPVPKNEFEGMTEEEILEKLQDRHYTVRIEGTQMSFNFDENGNVVADDAEEAKKFFTAFEKSSIANDMAQPEDAPSDDDGFKFDERYENDSYLFTLLEFVITHSRRERIYDKYSNSFVYGIHDIAFSDKNFDFLCDKCGCCLTGCVDGDLFTYDETSDPYGIHKKSFEIEYYNEETGQTEIQTQYYYESEYRNADGICENCGKKICPNGNGHEFRDGVCDNCGFCLDAHTDDNFNFVCDKCGICIGGHADSDSDGVCDKCSVSFACMHDEGVTNGICDTCGMCYLSDHYDSNLDGLCDRCGRCCGEHTDEEYSGDGFCDVCGACITGHNDTDSDGFCNTCGFTTDFCMHPDKDEDGICDICKGCASGRHTNNDLDVYCDVCGMVTPSCTNHVDEIQDECIHCGADYCAVPNTVEMAKTAEWFKAAIAYIDNSPTALSTGTKAQQAENKYIRSLCDTVEKSLSSLELTYTGLPEIKQLIESTDIMLNGYLAAADDLIGMSAQDIVSEGLDASLTTTISGLLTVFDGVLAKTEEKTVEEDETSTFTARLREYCAEYCSDPEINEGIEARTEKIGKLAELGREVLLKQIYNVLGENYKNGEGFITKENRLEKRQAATALNYDLYNILYTDKNAILKTRETEKFIEEDAGGLADKIWQQKDKKDFSSYDKDKRVILGIALNDKALNKIRSMLTLSFTEYDQNKEKNNTIPKFFDDEGNEIYAVRGKMDNDLARENPGDEYYVTDDSMTEMVRKLDNFITSQQFLKLLGIEKYGSLEKYVTDTVDGMLSDGEMLNGVINNLISAIFPMICGMLDGGLDEIIENMMKKNLKGVDDISCDDGEIEADLRDAVNFFLSEVLGWNETLSKVLTFFGLGFYGQNLEVDFNGADGTTKLRKIIKDKLGISIYPKEVGEAIASFDTQKALSNITNELKKAGDNWEDVSINEFDWGIKDLNTLKYALSALLSPFKKIVDFAFGMEEKLNINLNKVARAKFTALFFGIFPLPFNLPFNIEVKTGKLDIYGQIIVPLFEALGINQNVEGATADYSYIMPKKLDKSKNTAVVDSFVDPLLALVRQIAANPAEKLLNMIPNIMFYIQEGFIPELLDVNFNFEEVELRFVADSGEIISAVGALLPSIALILTKVYIAPALATSWIPIVGKIILAAAIALSVTAAAIWTAAEIYLATGVDLTGMANSALDLGNILSGFVSKKNLGFDVSSISDILKYVLGDSPLMKIVNKVNFKEMGYLGSLEKMSGSSRDARASYKYWSGKVSNRLLEEGEYYYVKADLGDVVWFLTDTVVSILGDKEAFKAVADITGMRIEDIQTVVDGLNLDEYGINISVGDTISGIKTEDILFVLSELIVPSDKYDLKELKWAEADEKTKKDVEEHDGNIPYLEYDNIWDKDLANALTADISGSVDSILEMADGMMDLKATLGIDDVSSLGAIVNGLLDKYCEPSIVTQVVTLLSGLSDTLDENAEMVEMLTRLDLTQWKNDFGYLFNGGDAPGNKFLPLLTGEKNGDVIIWKYNGEEVKTAEDIINAVCYLLKPLEKVLDYLFCGRDLGVVAYDKKDGVSGEVITLKGSESYNCVVIPFLEALGISADKIPSQKEFNDMGSSRGLAVMLNLILGRVLEIINSPDFISDILEIFTQLIYMFSSGGLDVLVSDLLHPVFVLIDILRPVFNLDVDGIINTLICKYTYTIGGYESEKEMQEVMAERKSEFKIENLTSDMLFKTVSVIASVKDGDDRLFLDVTKVLNTAFNDLACLREEYTSESVDSEGEPVTGYKISADGADSLTIMISFIMEILMYGNTGKIIDGIIGMPGLAETVADFLWGIVVEYSNDFNWAYILGEDATPEEKEALLSEIKEKGSISVEGRRTEEAQKAFDKYFEDYENAQWNRWDKETAEYLENYLTEMLETVLNEVPNEETGDRLAETLFEDADFLKDRDITIADVLNYLIDGYITDETVDKMVYLVASLLKDGALSEYKDIIYCVDGILDIDLSLYEAADSKKSVLGDKVIYLDADGNETGLTRRTVKTKNDFSGALADILKPFSKAVSWLLLGDDLEFFNTAGALGERVVGGVAELKERRDDLICVTGSEGYKYGLIPLLEAIGCENLLSADSYEKDGVYNTDKFLEDLIGSIMSWVLDLIGDGNGQSVIDNLVTMLPNLFYYINSNGLTVSVNNIISMISTALDIYSEKSGQDVSLATLLGFPLDNLTFNGIFDIIESFEFDKADGSGEKCNLTFNSFLREVLSTFTIGEIYYNSDSVFVYDTYGMRFGSDSDRAKMLVILASFVFDFLEDPDNKDVFASVLSPEIADTITNVFDMANFRFDMQDFSWKFTEYEGSDTLINALEMSDLFKSDSVYGELFTRKMAAELAGNLEQFISDMLYLIGLEVDGIAVRDFRSLVHMLLGSLVFNGDTINTVTSLLGQIKPLLDTYDKDGYIAGFIKELLDIDLHSWDDYAPGGKYENGRDWGFDTENLSEESVDKNIAAFENALIELLAPIAPLITWLMCEDDFTMFIEGDGLGNSEPIQLTVCGAEAYAYSFVPLLEAMNVDGSPKNLTENLRRNNILPPEEYTEKAKKDNEYALYGIVHPLMAKIGDITDSTLTEVLELLPSIVYFINCNGLDTCVKNLIHAGLIILNAIEPVGRQIEMFVYDEQGINIYKTIDFEGIIKNNVYTLLGITEDDMVGLYRSMGDEYNTVDGLEDIDFKFLFAVLVAKLNGLMKDLGLEFKFTTIAGDAIKELTCGYVRGFTSLNGRQAYTMILSKDIDSQCYGDLITIIIRLVLKFLSTDNNADALMHLIQAKAKMNPMGYEIVDSLLKLLVRYMASPNNAQIAMLAIYYTVYGVSRGSGAGVDAYDNVTYKWKRVINKLEGLNNPIAAEIMKTLISIADENAEGVIDSDGIASNGFFGFFKKIIDWFKKLFESIKRLFS